MTSPFRPPLCVWITMALSVFLTAPLAAQTPQTLPAWTSEVTGQAIARTEIVPSGTAANATMPTVIYLQNLASARVGREADETIIQSFLDQGMMVVTMDYADHAKARVPFINVDLQTIRQQIENGASVSSPSARPFSTLHSMNANLVFIVPEGCRLKRNVIYNGTRGMDIVYPSDPLYPVGGIVEFTADNVNRMGNGSLVFCKDTLMPAMAMEGFAFAMADHPVQGTYAGLDPMPDSAQNATAAVQTLRAQRSTLPLNGKIATLGFSRGSGVALMAATTADVESWRFYLAGSVYTYAASMFRTGSFPDEDKHVQGAVLMSGRFTYIDLLPTDGKAQPGGIYYSNWGPMETNLQRWTDQGALDYMTEDLGIPFFICFNNDDEHAQHQMQVLQDRFDAMGVEYTYMFDDEQPLAHRMPLNHSILNAMTRYFRGILMDPSPETAIEQTKLSTPQVTGSQLRWSANTVLPAADYVLEKSTDLQVWQDESTVRPTADGSLDVEVAVGAGEPTFYRLSSPKDPAE